jgi:signal transduction histidine kinase/putative methionine-R-sulfoxide reductase with GAF domain
MSEEQEHSGPWYGPSLGRFIAARKHEILMEWEAAVRRLPIARELPRPLLIDEIPELLDAIAASAPPEDTEQPDVAGDVIEAHALQRLESGYDLSQVIIEYALLRDCIARAWDRELTPPAERGALRGLHRAIDRSISVSVQRFREAHDRATRALDRIALTSLESRNLEDLLGKLLRVLVDTVPAIDTAAILLREGDRLRLRAAVGIPRLVEEGHSVPLGEGFAGRIAKERRPVFLRPGPDHPIAQSPVGGARGIRALYGVPMMEGDDLVGVTHIGSRTAADFSEQDRRILGMMAHRATAAIAQQVLRQEAERRAVELDAVIESIPEAVYIADRSRILRSNRRGAELLGANQSDTAQVLESAFAAALGRRTVVKEDIVHRGGQERIIRSATAPIEIEGRVDAAVSVVADITEAKRQEHERLELLMREQRARERAESAERAQRFLSEATAILASSLEYDRTLDSVTRLVVRELADWCAVDLLDAGGKLGNVAVAQADAARVRLAREPGARWPAAAEVAVGGPGQVIATGASVLVDDTRHDALRELGIQSVILVPVSARDRVLGTLTLVLAGSGRRYAAADRAIAEDLGRRAGLAVENARLYRAAREATQLRERLLAMVSHDLRSPLSAIALSATVLLGHAHAQGDARSAAQLETIQRAVARMTRLIGDLLDLANIGAGQLKVEKRREPARELVAEALDLQEPLARAAGITLTRDLPIGGLFVDCDRERIFQVLSNLTDNAIKFSRAGDEVAVRARRRGDAVEIEVKDHGPGIPPEELGAIFDPYWSRERQGKKGSGLGLFIAKGIVAAHGGRIWAESETGRGTSLLFTLPIAAEP